MLFTVLVILFVLICLLMVLVILMQSSKGGGLASSFGGMGGGSSLLGARGTANFLSKATMFLGISYGVITILIGITVSAMNTGDGGQSEAEQLFEKQKQEMTIPAAPFNPADAHQVIDGSTAPLKETKETEKADETKEDK
ncbi:MAG: preprotein translocase subunit SecG [Calditrichia bacterium]|nr:preprotein translocase subunit SecG [Calditrichia bacterium]